MDPVTFPEEQAAISAILKTFTSPRVVELGAQTGEDSEWMMPVVAGKDFKWVMVEADRSNYEVLIEKKFQARVVYGAIADHNGECDFWESHNSGYSGFGSIYKPLEGMMVAPHQFRKGGPVPCFTFDSLFAKFAGWDRIDLLYVDIHGAEKDMIAHGQNALQHTRYMMIEFFDSPVYEGMALRSDLLRMLPGWTVLRQFPWNLLLRNDNV